MQILFIGYEATDSRIGEGHEAGYTVNHRPGPLDTADQHDLWKSLRNAPPDIVWIRWESLETPDIASLRRFRVSRTKVRIIVDIPDALDPPDSGLAELVGMGIYDIVRVSQPLPSILTASPSYADALRWQHDADLTWDDEATPAPPAPPQIIEKERIVVRPTSHRTTIIVCWSAVHGAGGTTLAMAVARTLSQFGTVAALDHGLPTGPDGGMLDGQSGLTVLGKLEPNREGMEIIVSDWEHDEREHRHYQSIPDPAEYARKRRWDYMVVDAGVPTKGVQERLMGQADLNLMLLPPVPSRTIGTWHWLSDLGVPNLRVVVFGVKMAHWLTTDAPADQLPVLGLPWPEESGHAEALESLLAPILPSEPESVRKARRLRRWKRYGVDALGVVVLLVLVRFGWHHVVPVIRHWLAHR